MCLSFWTRADTATLFVLTCLLSEGVKICVTFRPLSSAIVHPTLTETECAFIAFQDSCREGWHYNKAWWTANERLIQGTRKAPTKGSKHCQPTWSWRPRDITVEKDPECHSLAFSCFSFYLWLQEKGVGLVNLQSMRILGRKRLLLLKNVSVWRQKCGGGKSHLPNKKTSFSWNIHTCRHTYMHMCTCMNGHTCT